MRFLARHRLLVLGVLLTAVAFLGNADGASATQDPPRLGLASDPRSPHSATHVLVRLDDPVDVFRTLGTDTESLGKGWFRVRVPEHWQASDWIRRLAGRQGVAATELDLMFQPMVEAPFTANDPLYLAGPIANAQWHLHAVDVAGAWQSSVGAGVVVAVLDTGVNDGTDGFCNPFVAEYNAVTNSAGPGTAADAEGHGTHVAGSVAQCSGNAVGGAGMAPEARIMPVEVFSADGASAGDVARGIHWAIDHGADVINLSLGCDCASESSILNSAIERAHNADVLIVGAAGNSPIGIFYPASHPSVIAVGATTYAGGVAGYSARGLGLELVAPGGDPSGPIWQETLGGYRPRHGTSMAAGHVSGAAALLRARFPNAPAAQIRSAMSCSTRDLGPGGWDGDSGHGLLQAGDAMQQLAQMVQSGAWTCDGQGLGSASLGAIHTASGFWRLYQGTSQVASFYFGNPGDVGFLGDWNCDGIDTPGLYRSSDGYVYLRNSNTQGIADVSFFFGNPGDIPIAGDFDGDGCDTVSIYRPSEARFYIINKLGSRDGGLGAADYSFLYGVPGDVPFVGDWDGDGDDTPGLRRASDGFVYLRNTNSQGVANISFFFGDQGDVVFAGDWDGDKDDTVGLYRPGNGVIYLRNTNTTGVADGSFWVGGGMQPASGDF